MPSRQALYQLGSLLPSVGCFVKCDPCGASLLGLFLEMGIPRIHPSSTELGF